MNIFKARLGVLFFCSKLSWPKSLGYFWFLYIDLLRLQLSIYTIILLASKHGLVWQCGPQGSIFLEPPELGI